MISGRKKIAAKISPVANTFPMPLLYVNLINENKYYATFSYTVQFIVVLVFLVRLNYFE